MTDKVQKIREEVERLKEWNNNVRNSTRHMTLQEEDFNRGKHSSYLEILNFIDSLQEEPVSEELEKVSEAYVLDDYIKPWRELVKEAFKAGAKWQKSQDQSTIELAEDHAMLAGMEKMKEEMMMDAIDVTVHMDSGGYPYIPQIEFYDYDKDIPLTKEGDRYKVILIKDK